MVGGFDDLRCAVPHRPESRLPVVSTPEAMLVRLASWQSLSATSMCCPRPVLWRASSAASTLCEVYRPVVRSVIATPTFTGGPSRSPVMCMRPNSLVW